MNHSGFGSLTIVHAGLAFVVPSEALTSQGKVKKATLALIHRCKTITDAMKLAEFGFEITTA